MNAVELAINIVSKGSTAGFDATKDAAKSMASSVSTSADVASSKIDGISSSAENLDDKSGKATGALGALSSGFELIGAGDAAVALQSAAMATDFLSGAGQALNLVLGLESVQHAKAAAQAVVHTVATTAQSAAAKASAAAQWALNAALSANPIGLVIAAILVLVGLFVLAYKNSETFRAIVQTTMKAAAAAIGPVIDAIGDLIGWVRDKLSPVWDGIQKAAGNAFDLVAGVLDGAESKVMWLKDKAVGYFELMIAPVVAIKDAIQAVIDAIGKIDFPDLPSLPGWVPGAGRAAVAPTAPTTTLGGGYRPTKGNPYPPVGPVVNVAVNGSGIVDENAVARTVAKVTKRQLERHGRG